MEKIELKSGLKVMFTLYKGNELARAKSLTEKLEPDTMIPLDGTDLQIKIIKVHSIIEADPGSLYETTYTIKMEGELI